jgi:hypothetical protein
VVRASADTHAHAVFPACLQSQSQRSALIGGHMLNNEEELSLMEGLRVAAGDEWLPMLYRCRCKKYMQQVRQ